MSEPATATAHWHLRQVERILIDAEEREGALCSGKYGTDELHDCKVAVWKLLDLLPDDLGRQQ